MILRRPRHTKFRLVSSQTPHVVANIAANITIKEEIPLRFGKKQIRLSNGGPALAFPRPSIEN